MKNANIENFLYKFKREKRKAPKPSDDAKKRAKTNRRPPNDLFVSNQTTLCGFDKQKRSRTSKVLGVDKKNTIAKIHQPLLMRPKSPLKKTTAQKKLSSKEEKRLLREASNKPGQVKLAGFDLSSSDRSKLRKRNLCAVQRNQNAPFSLMALMDGVVFNEEPADTTTVNPDDDSQFPSYSDIVEYKGPNAIHGEYAREYHHRSFKLWKTDYIGHSFWEESGKNEGPRLVCACKVYEEKHSGWAELWDDGEIIIRYDNDGFQLTCSPRIEVVHCQPSSNIDASKTTFITCATSIEGDIFIVFEVDGFVFLQTKHFQTGDCRSPLCDSYEYDHESEYSDTLHALCINDECMSLVDKKPTLKNLNIKLEETCESVFGLDVTAGVKINTNTLAFSSEGDSPVLCGVFTIKPAVSEHYNNGEWTCWKQHGIFQYCPSSNGFIVIHRLDCWMGCLASSLKFHDDDPLTFTLATCKGAFLTAKRVDDIDMQRQSYLLITSFVYASVHRLSPAVFIPLQSYGMVLYEHATKDDEVYLELMDMKNRSTRRLFNTSCIAIEDAIIIDNDNTPLLLLLLHNGNVRIFDTTTNKNYEIHLDKHPNIHACHQHFYWTMRNLPTLKDVRARVFGSQKKGYAQGIMFDRKRYCYPMSDSFESVTNQIHEDIKRTHV